MTDANVHTSISPAIYGTVLAVMRDLDPIAKEKRNQQQNFNYRGIDDVMNALQPLLSKHGLFIAPEVLEQTREERQNKNGGTLIYSMCRIRYTFYASDGSSVSAVVIGEAMDSGDKASNKAMAVAFKYACFQVFCIPTEEMKDPDAQSHEVETKPAAAKRTAPPASEQPAPITKEQQAELVKMSKEKWGADNAGQHFKEYTKYDKTGDVPASEFLNVKKKIEDAPPF